MKKILVLLFLFNMLSVQAATLTFATEATYPPFESVDSSGKIVGFDIDIMNALCKQMKAQCTIANAPFDSLIPSLNIGKYDAIIAAMAITSQRMKVVTFTNSYYEDTVSFVAPKDSHLTIDVAGLKGKTIGVQGDTTFYQYLKAIYGKEIKINTYKSQESAFLDLTSGRVNAVMGDTPLVTAWLKQDGHDKEYATFGKPINNPKFFGVGNGIALKKGNTALLTELNTALAAIKKNGEDQKIIQKWFGQKESNK